jgi:Spy/CpxP family protein refolding chaperone
MLKKGYLWAATTALLLTTAVAVQAERPWGDKPKGGDPLGDMDGGWGKHGDRDEDARQPRQPLTQEQKDEVQAFLKEVAPERMAKLDKLRTERPELYEKVLAANFGKMKHLKELKSNDPKAYEQKVQLFVLQGKVMDLAKDYRNSQSDGDKKKIKGELDGLLNKLFDLRQAEREQDLVRFKERLQKFEADIQKRKENKDKVIKMYTDKLLGDSEGLEW